MSLYEEKDLYEGFLKRYENYGEEKLKGEKGEGNRWHVMCHVTIVRVTTLDLITMQTIIYIHFIHNHRLNLS